MDRDLRQPVIVSDRTRQYLGYHRRRRELLALGYERVFEDGDPLWELVRGPRQRHRIVAVEIDPDGTTVWIKIEPAFIVKHIEPEPDIDSVNA